MIVKNQLIVYLTYVIVWWNSFRCSNGQDIKSVGSFRTDPISQRPLPYALSATDLTYLAMKEQGIYQNFANYASELENRLKLIKTYMKDYEESSLKITENASVDMDDWDKATVVSSNTLTAYRMIRRFAKDFKRLEENLQERLESDLLYEMSTASDVYGFPTAADHVEAMGAILRLHDFYDLDINKFTSGNILGIETKGSLNAQQCLEIAKHAVNTEYFTLAMDWINSAGAKLNLENDTSCISRRDINDAYQRNVALHDRDYNLKHHREHKYIFAKKLSEDQNSTAMKQLYLKKFLGDRDPENQSTSHYNFMALCKGENFQTEAERSALYCWYDTESNPYWRINPLKKEVLSIEPSLVQMYDVIGDDWISYLTETALPTLERAPQGKASKATPRTATYAWLSDEDIPLTPLSRRIELVTGLNVRGELASEYLQIAAYAFGGHVATHVDSLADNPYDPTIQDKGNRVTTFLLYLNDVAKGGRTAFPVLGTSVEPVKGSAVMWYTSLKNGNIDRRLLHAACPVFGHKWIATKWTHLNVNFLKRPCSTNPRE